MDYSLLDCQAEFCNSKGRGDFALEIAKRSVISAPSEFVTWARLAEIYVSLEQWDLALLTLNSCPMFTYQDKDAPQLPNPLRVNLPVLPEALCDEIDDTPSETEHVHPNLRKLHAAEFKGTFLKAYKLLTEITKKIGWDQLLRVRSQVFVMEEEYRHEKQVVGSHQGSTNASTTALRGTPSPKVNGNAESDAARHATAGRNAKDHAGEDAISSGQAAGDSLERPSHTITSAEVKAGSEDVGTLSLRSRC